MDLTQREKDLVAFIRRFMRQYGIPPTYAEMAEGLGLKSRGNAHRLIKSLLDKGYVKSYENKFRTVQLTEKAGRGPGRPKRGSARAAT